SSSILLPSFFCSQFAIAERSNFSRLLEASLELCCNILRALFTSTPLTRSATNLIFLGAIGDLFNFAKAIDLFSSFLFSALSLFLAPITQLIIFSYLFYSQHAHGSYALEKILPTCVLPYSQCKTQE